jgi:nicotinamide phosphoribosyltransferase
MITDINPMCLIDGYKTSHKFQYPVGTEFVYSNFTPRQSRMEGVNEIVFFGLQYFIKEYLIDRWNKGFFSLPKEQVLKSYKRRMDNYLGPDAIPCEHIAELHDLGYLPLKIKALPEGCLVPMGIPVFTIVNTQSKFFWLTNYFETLMSNIFWKPTTSATTAFQYRRKFEEFADKTGYDKSFIQWQGHDFSFRGMSGNEDAFMSGAGHLLSFTGTDSIPTIDFLEMYYNADSDKELIGGSVPATEHSVASLCTFVSENKYTKVEEEFDEVTNTWKFKQYLH